MGLPLNRVEIFDAKGVIITLPTFRPKHEAGGILDLKAMGAGSDCGWRYVNAAGRSPREILCKEVSP